MTEEIFPEKLENAIGSEPYYSALAIYHIYGIKLTWQELLTLKHYFVCFNQVDFYKNLGKGKMTEISAQFMLDLFGLDRFELTGEIVQKRDSEGRFKVGTNSRGWNLLNKVEFMQYCQNHVDNWRTERELI